ncbi:hypothetical protein [Castellaniella sp.]|uniref:hypothetical protein n=1 Tax=Castellaniella sp. TaxID=1955812 RepID=UPI002AFDCFE2|nr:hypothetical protein [Castellaniella sp.]
MAWLEPDSTVLGMKLSTLAAGAGGGIVRAILLRHGWIKSCLGVIVGVVFAVQGTPIIAAIVDRQGFGYLPDPQVDSVAAALLGMVGLTIAEVALARVKALGTPVTK